LFNKYIIKYIYQIKIMPNGFKYLSVTTECNCQSLGGTPTTLTYINQCGLTSTISCPVSPNVSGSFYAIEITNYTGSKFTVLNEYVLVNQSSSGLDPSMDNNTIKDNLMVFAINSRAYGPTNVTGFYAGLTPPSSGYTIYSVRTGCSNYDVRTANDETLIGIANSYGAGVESIYEALDWAINQKWISVVNKDYGNIYTDYLYFCIDPSFSASFPRGGETAYSIASYPNWSGNSAQAVMINGGWGWNSTSGGGSWGPKVDPSGYFECQESFYGEIEFTIDCWYASSTSDSDDILFQTDPFVAGPNGVQIQINNSTRVYVNLFENGNLRSEVFNTNTLTANTFCNIVLTYNNTNGFKLYINNTNIGSVNNYKVEYSANSFRYGGNGILGKVNGSLSTLKVYYKDLSLISGALTQNYNAVSSQYV
jgi:hypothetical protein